MIVQDPSPNYTKGRNGFKIIAIELHITEGSYDSALGEKRLGWMKNKISQVSSHYLLDGYRTVQLVQDEDTAWHTGNVINPTWKGLIPGIPRPFKITPKWENPNQYTLGIEIAAPDYLFFPSWKYWLRVAKFVKEKAAEHNLPLDSLHIIGHNEIRADKKCPGRWFTPFYILLLIKYFLKN